MIWLKFWAVVLLACLVSAVKEEAKENEIGRDITTGEDLVAAVSRDCVTGDETITTCLRQKVLSYVDSLVGVRNDFEGRGLSDKKMDVLIAKRLKKYFDTHEFKVQLPQFLFEEAVLTFTPSKGLADFKVDFPPEPKGESRAISEARGHLKKKLLFPLLLLLKLKIKALTPILLILLGIKAVKAFIMSKISILLVLGFMFLQLFKKKGMMGMPMAMMPGPMATEAPVYGPPQTPPTYGPPAAPAPDTSYGPWEPTNNNNNNNNNANGNSNGNPYSRWDSHNIVYNAHQPESTGKSTSGI